MWIDWYGLYMLLILVYVFLFLLILVIIGGDIIDYLECMFKV